MNSLVEYVDEGDPFSLLSQTQNVTRISMKLFRNSLKSFKDTIKYFR